MTPLERITERVTRHGPPGESGVPLPLVTVDEFFAGNDAVGSIGCNLAGAPPPGRFYELFKGITAREDVKDIRVLVIAFDVPEWPFSDAVYIMTSADADAVTSWFPNDLRPDDIAVDLDFAEIADFEPCIVPPGVHAVRCWWDQQRLRLGRALPDWVFIHEATIADQLESLAVRSASLILRSFQRNENSLQQR